MRRERVSELVRERERERERVCVCVSKRKKRRKKERERDEAGVEELTVRKNPMQTCRTPLSVSSKDRSRMQQ